MSRWLFSLPMGWIPWNFPYRLPKEFQATPKGLGFQTFTSHFFPANLHCFLPKLRCVPLNITCFSPNASSFSIIFLQTSFPIQKNTPYIYIYFQFSSGNGMFFPPNPILFLAGPFRGPVKRHSKTCWWKSRPWSRSSACRASRVVRPGWEKTMEKSMEIDG